MVMGLPFVRGGFVGGDDHRLLLNHVLVNHPSLEHAVQLFRIVHRDLYQPIPLLSFSGEFALANALGLFDRGVPGGAWLFHLTNVLLHAVNAVLVYLVLVRLMDGLRPEATDWSRSSGAVLAGHAPQRAALDAPPTPCIAERSSGGAATRRVKGGSLIAAIAGVLFAIHPLQVEVVAWLNGRMMLLSTLFALASLLTWARWLRAGRPVWAAATLLLVTLGMMSKVRVGVPVLLLIAAIAATHSPESPWSGPSKLVRSLLSQRRFLPLWMVCTFITAVFIYVNWRTTAESEFFTLAGEHMSGPRVVRVLRSLAWYVQHFVWPTGLASWYPAPPEVAGSDPETAKAIGILVPSAALIALACRKWSGVGWGVLWFLATIVDTLPIVPARNVLAADRYMYLSIIGLAWVAAIVVNAGFVRIAGSRKPALGLAAAVGVALLAQSWHTGSFYATAILKTERIAMLFPMTPHVWARLGWAYHRAGNTAAGEGRKAEAETHYGRAIASAERELVQENPHGWSEACQVIGATQLKRGDVPGAMRALQRAVELDPQASEPKFYLASAYDDLGRPDEALALYESILTQAPGHNPTLLRLAKVYRSLGRAEQARAAYERALSNNAYEVPATLGLVELDLEQRTDEAHRAAERRLIDLLSWMPENNAARVSLGVVYHRLGREAEAIREYEKVLARNPREVAALLNLAHIHLTAGDLDRARLFFERAALYPLESLEQVVDLQDFFLSIRDFDEAANLWEPFLARYPQSAEAMVFAAWCFALTGETQRARRLADSLGANEKHPLLLATKAYLQLGEGRYELARKAVAELCALGRQGTDARRRLLAALELFDKKQPNVPWTFGLAAQLLVADGRVDAARVFLDLFAKNCQDADCAEFLHSLQAALAAEP